VQSAAVSNFRVTYGNFVFHHLVGFKEHAL
jgi:hypothetical protein